MGGEEMVVRDEPRRGVDARVARDSYSANAIANTAALANTPTISTGSLVLKKLRRKTHLARIPRFRQSEHEIGNNCIRDFGACFKLHCTAQ